MNKNNLTDKFGRKYKYLRVSVTDRCNFRCKYCMPTHNFTMLKHSDILSYEEMIFAVNIFAKLGINKIRVTGGEPLVRKDIEFFLKELKEINGIKEVTLTTNGSLLDKLANQIYEAGIKRINVSLDSLKPDRYMHITGGFEINKVLKGIEAAKNAGLSPVKINTVAIKGFNDDEIIDFCEFASVNNLNVRFIEFMPIGNNFEWKKDNIITGDEILKIIREKYDIVKIEKSSMSGPAENYKLSNGAIVGIITPISNHFCNECDKLRLTSDGKIRPCLLSDNEIDVSQAIKNKDEKLLFELLKKSLNTKEEHHSISADTISETYKRTMSKIGG
jgi:cyclic pyranopterin phosphate synthase